MPSIPSPKWREGMITIQVVDYETKPPTPMDSQRVQAEVYGCFAITHMMVEGVLKTDRYSITHVPTGLCCGWVWWKDDAKTIIELLYTFRDEFASSSQEEIMANTPQFIRDWLAKCTKAGKYVDLEIPE